MGEIVLALEGVSHRYAGAERDAVRDVVLRVERGELVGVVGPNGSGKTTLLRLLAGIVDPSGGEVVIENRPIAGWTRRDLARVVAVVAQREEPVFPLRVHEAVSLGRYPHLGALAAPGRYDHEIVAEAMRRCDVHTLGDRWIATLSGGEWQRVRVARALAQQPHALVLDEATASLDVRHEMEVLELTADLVHTDGLAGVIVTHHLNLAARFVDRLLIMADGAAVASGPPGEVLTRDVLESVFGWPVEIAAWRGIPQFVPLRRSERE